jgi:hypothetical protein
VFVITKRLDEDGRCEHASSETEAGGPSGEYGVITARGGRRPSPGSQYSLCKNVPYRQSAAMKAVTSAATTAADASPVA